MSTLRLSGDVRREQIREAAKGCFARYGFAGTTTKSVARAAGVSEGLLFKHFPTKAALYGEILTDACDTDPGLHRLLELQPSTATLVILVREMVAHFLCVSKKPDRVEAQRIRLLISSQLDDGEFARLLFDKIGDLIGPVFSASLESAVKAGDATPVAGGPLNLFWFAHQVVHMIALTRLSATPSLTFSDTPDLAREVCSFILRGIGLTEKAIASHIDAAVPPLPATGRLAEST